MLKRLRARLRGSGPGDEGSYGGQSILKNMSAGFALQIANYVFPLVQLPYLARVLGVEGLGLVLFVTNLVAYCGVLIDWGFPLGATRHVARNRLDPQALHDIFWTTITARMILFGGSLAGLALLALSPFGHPYAGLLVWGAITLLAAVITPDWYFQGLERMVLLTSLAFVGRTVTLLLVFLLVHDRGDVWKYVALTGGTMLLVAILTLWRGRALLPPGRPTFDVRAALRQIRDYRHFFFTRASIMAYTMSAPVLLGIVSGTATTGIYGGAERISRAVLALLNQVSSVIFPRVNALMANDMDAAARAIRRMARLQIAGTALASLALFVLAEPIILILLGPAFAQSVTVLRWLALLPVVIGASNILGIQMMIPLGMQKEVFRISLVSAVLFLSLLAGLGKLYGAPGAGAALVLVELVVTGLQAGVLWTRQREFCRAVLGKHR